ncbi:AraC family transcriptional regulator [Oceanicoccus sp. KOV_DT_Chl]|uniref:AraC family transcriptional regulator n=1 Tax=Oceanicoccus sp. KOV_DT_Chl TaxID=1904639 RepID=UPI000C7AE0DA|nr:AraC family transcriptional regulator [Oceanicoccus sp. KOV_DT_Chl]
MATEEIIIPTSYITTLLKEVSDRGYDPFRLLADVGIDPAALEQQRYFSALHYGKLYQRAIGVMQDEWFGMLSGGKIRPGSFRLLSLLMVQCKTLRQALIRAWEFGQICRGFRISILLEEVGDVARVSLAPLDNLSQEGFNEIIKNVRPVVIHTTLASWQQHWSWLIGSDLKADRTLFTFTKPEQEWEMAQFSSDELIFDYVVNGFEFPASYLDATIIQTEESVEDFLRRAPFGIVINAGSGHTTKSRVMAILNQNVGHNMLGTERVAEQLCMSVTTLRRHLQLEGTTFQRLKDECRMQAAFHYLASADLGNRDIADRLGFDEVSAFFRAFKKWTGVTPGQYRAADKVIAGSE